MSKEYNFIENTIDLPMVDHDVIKFYSGLMDINGMEILFPDLELGCINFGFWNSLPEKIDKKTRLDSQINLYKKVISFLENGQDRRILEVGCGRGHGVHLMLNYGFNPMGIDAVPSQISLCKDNYPQEAHRFIQGYAADTSFSDESFDGIITLEAAQHFPDFEAFIKESYRILKPNGELIISTFFFTGYSSNPAINDILPLNVLGSHHAVGIEYARELLSAHGFSNINILSIGENVFKGFCKWALQEKPHTKHSSQWVDAYELKYLDYFIIKCSKQ
ncbi:MAG: class I SAM-dependent methyltransferase [Candidatus Rhabdochlamydia sp.]